MTMKLTSDQLAALKRFKPVMEGFAAVQAFLDDNATMESLQQAYNETEARLNDKREEEKKLDGRIAAVAGVEADAKKLLSDATQHADATLVEARIEADKLKKTAQATADGIVDRAKEAALRIKKDAQAELPAIEASIEKKRDEFTHLANATDDKQKELDALNRDLDAAKDHIKLLLQPK